jgi:trimeric autotransporter adhesin
VFAVAVIDDGQGPALYIAGDFLTFLSEPQGMLATRVVKWDGTNWSALASGVNGRVQTLAEFDDGRGPALFAGGQFSVAGDVGSNNIAKWDGNEWSSVSTAGSAESGRLRSRSHE